jgi:hypothetical protein
MQQGKLNKKFIYPPSIITTTKNGDNNENQKNSKKGSQNRMQMWLRMLKENF